MSKPNKNRGQNSLSQATDGVAGLPNGQSLVNSSGYRIIPWGLALILLVTLAVVFAEPQKSGDLWWQMAYGRYMLENHTLIPDHTIYSWSPTVGNDIYCAWISEIVLYLLYQAGGLSVLFALRYLSFLLFVFLLWHWAKKNKVASHPLIWLVCLISLLMSVAADTIKPQMFTFVLMTLTVATWWRIKMADEKAWRYCYGLPLIMLVWVNTHAGFMFGAFFLVLVCTGELMNRLLSSEEGLSPAVRKHLLIGVTLSGLTVFVTPYGWNYPAALFVNYFWGGTEAFHLRTVSEYASPFDPAAYHFYFFQYLVLAFLTLMMLHLRKGMKQLDWSLILTNVAFGGLYCLFLRTTFYFAPVFAFAAVKLLSRDPIGPFFQEKLAGRLIRSVIILLFLLIAGRAVCRSVVRTEEHHWCGFGVASNSPVEEARFIKKYLSDYDRVGTDYDNGGYLLWSLWPRMKVFNDSRFFPYKNWGKEYVTFQSGIDVPRLLDKYPADIWCVSTKHMNLIKAFTRIPGWKVACYGASAFVFVRKDVKLPEGVDRECDNVMDSKGFQQTVRILVLMTDAGDFKGFRRILDSANKRFTWPSQKIILESFDQLYQGVQAFLQRDYNSAFHFIEASQQVGIISLPHVQANTYHFLARAAWVRDGDIQKAVQLEKSALRLNKDDIFSLFNLGSLLYEHQKGGAGAPKSGRGIKREIGDGYDLRYREDYKPYLERFLLLSKSAPGQAIPTHIVSIAESMLRGSYHGKPVFLNPQEPPLLKDTKKLREKNG